MSDLEYVNQFLREIRMLVESSQLSQRQVEEKAGLSRGYLSQLLSSQRELKVWQMLAVLGALDCHPGEFFERADPRRTAARRPSINRRTAGVADSRSSRFTTEAPWGDGDIDRVKERLQHLGFESVDALRGRLVRCELAVAELDASAILGPSESNWG